MIKDLLISKKWITLIFVILLLFGLSIVLIFDKNHLHLIFNQYHSTFWDIFFKYATYLGDGIVFPICIILLFFIKKEWATSFLYAGLLTLVLTYVFKKYVFLEFARPFEVFGEQLHLINGVEMKHWNSFPSGHTTSAFALFMLFAFYVKRFSYQIIFFLLAIIAGWSRIYLSQHFLEDVLGGAILGFSIAVLGYYFGEKYPLKFLNIKKNQEV